MDADEESRRSCQLLDANQQQMIDQAYAAIGIDHTSIQREVDQRTMEEVHRRIFWERAETYRREFEALQARRSQREREYEEFQACMAQQHQISRIGELQREISDAYHAHISPHAPQSINGITVPPAGGDRRTDDEAEQCIVCCDNERCVTLVPCGHLRLCIGCARTICAKERLSERICPVCRAAITVAVKTFK